MTGPLSYLMYICRAWFVQTLGLPWRVSFRYMISRRLSVQQLPEPGMLLATVLLVLLSNGDIIKNTLVLFVLFCTKAEGASHYHYSFLQLWCFYRNIGHSYSCIKVTHMHKTIFCQNLSDRLVQNYSVSVVGAYFEVKVYIHKNTEVIRRALMPFEVRLQFYTSFVFWWSCDPMVRTFLPLPLPKKCTQLTFISIVNQTQSIRSVGVLVVY